MIRLPFKSHRQVRHAASVTHRRMSHRSLATWNEATLRVHALEQAFLHADRDGTCDQPRKDP